MASRTGVFSSSVGTKIAIGLTGVLLFLYLLIHIAGNLIVFFGPAAFNTYAFTLESNPLLERSVRHRFPYLDPLNHVQVELLKEHRAQNPDEQVLRGIQLTINGISAGLRNTG